MISLPGFFPVPIGVSVRKGIFVSRRASGNGKKARKREVARNGRLP